MDSGYSLSDIAAISDNGGFGGANAWVLIILFALIFGINGNGFGNRNGEFGQYATAASQNEILFGQQFQSLGNKVNEIGNGLCSSTYALNNAINGVNQNLGNAVTSEGRAIQNQLCAINANIDNKFASLEKSNLEQRIAEQSQQITQLQTAQLVCGVPKINPYLYGVYPYNTSGCNCGNI